MKRLSYGSCLFAFAALVFGMTARPVQAQVGLRIVGALSNFDCYNDTSGDCEGFEIEIEGIHKEDVTHTWNYSAFGAPTVTTGGTAAAPSAIIRYHSNSTVLHPAAVTHFGVTLAYYTPAGTVKRRWLPAGTITVPNPAPIPYVLPNHQSNLTNVNGSDSVHDSITNDTPDGVTILWVLPYGNKVSGRRVALEELMPTNAIVTNAVPMGSGSNHLRPSRLDPGMTWASDDPPGSDDTDSGVLWFEVYKDVATPRGNGGKVDHTPGALIGRVMDATITALNNPTVAALALSDTFVFGTQDVIGQVTLGGGTGGPNGVVVALTSDNPAATVPATITIPANQVFAQFTIHTTAVSALATANITASLSGTSKTASFTIKQPDLFQLYLSFASVGGGVAVNGNVFLTSPAPTGGTQVVLTSDNPAVAEIPASVTVPAGATGVTLTVVTHPVTMPTIVTFTATYNGLTKTATLRVAPNTVTVSGTVVLQYLAPNAPNQNITFTFCPTDGSASFDRLAPIGTNTAFAFTDIPAKIYTLHIKGAKYLARNLPVNASNNSVTGLTVILTAGDANNDNSVDIADFGLLVNAYGSDANIPVSGYDNHADFNNDSVIDIADFGLLVNNYGTNGDQ